jgi:hypothetical protein
MGVSQGTARLPSGNEKMCKKKYVTNINVLCDIVMYNFANCIFCVFDIFGPFGVSAFVKLNL